MVVCDWGFLVCLGFLLFFLREGLLSVLKSLLFKEFTHFSTTSILVKRPLCSFARLLLLNFNPMKCRKALGFFLVF